MKFKAKTKELANALQETTAIINDRAVIPICKDIRFDLQSVYLQLTGTDMQNTLIKQVEVEGEEDGKICLDGKMLLSVLKTLPDPMVSLELENKRMKLIASNGVYEIPVQDAKDFPNDPQMDKANTVSIASSILLDGVSKTVFAISNLETGRNIENMLFRIDGTEVVMVGLDGPRMSEYTAAVEDEHNFSLLLKPKSANLIKSFVLMDIVEINFNDRFLMIKSENDFLFCRLSEGMYVDHRSVIPANCSNYAVVDRHQLLSAIKRVLILANAFNHAIKIEFGESMLILSSEDKDFNKAAKEEVSASFVGNTTTIGLNGKFITEGLNAIDSENVRIEFDSPSRPVLFKPEDEDRYRYMCLIAPYNFDA